ncbi:hypothetical protein Tco_1380865 [Tanacetum coccineum]
MNRVNTFVDYRTKLVEESSKKAKAEIAHENSLKRAGEELEHERSKKQKLEEDKESEELKKCLEIVPDDGDDVTIEAVPLSIKSPSIVDWKIHKEGKKSYYQIIRADGSSKKYLVFSHMLKSFDREDLETLYKLVKAKYGSTRPVEDLDLVLYKDLKIMFEPHVVDNVWKNQSDYKGRIVGIKRLLDDLEVTAAQVCVTAAKLKFIENFSKLAKSLTILTQKCKTFDWGEEQELAFRTLKDKLCNAPVLALHDGPEDFVAVENS